jgi:hypothetical protein
MNLKLLLVLCFPTQIVLASWMYWPCCGENPQKNDDKLKVCSEQGEGMQKIQSRNIPITTNNAESDVGTTPDLTDYSSSLDFASLPGSYVGSPPELTFPSEDEVGVD